MAEKKSFMEFIYKIPILSKIHYNVALRTLIAALACFTLVIGALVWFSIQAQTDILLNQEKTLLETQYQTLSGRIKESTTLALSLAVLTANMPDIQNIFSDRNRKQLTEVMLKGYEALKQVAGKSIESQFHTPPATSFVRLYDLTKYGDDVAPWRPAVVNVNTNKVFSSGIEAGRYVVAIRGVVPVFFEGEHIGSVEFGTELTSEYLADIYNQYAITSALYIDINAPGVGAYFEALRAKHTEPFITFATSWKKGAEKVGAPIEIRRQVVQSSKPQIYYDIPNKHAIYVAPLKDYSNKNIGTMEVYLDRTQVLGEIEKSRNLSLGVGGGLALIGGLFILWLVNFSVGRPVREITSVYERIGMGDFSARSTITSLDEMGTMAASLNAMLDNTLTLIQSSEERDRMQNSIMKLLNEISKLAEGDLRQRAEVTEDFTGAIADAFNNMVEQLSRVVRDVKEATLQVSATAHEVSTSTEHLAESSEMQAVQVSDAIAAINEMATSIQQVSENAAQCAAVSEKSMEHAKNGAAAVRDTNAAMEAIREHVQETARAIKRLGESSQEVGNIVQLINDIADRTSILALNASIQAAMAGEAGRGFAVVAEEVQRLAERSTNATKQIDTLIKNIQGEINEAGASMEESIEKVVQGSKLADAAYAKLQEIEAVSAQLGEIIQSISLASKQQARASENIAKTMEEVGEISAQTSAASRQTAVSMKKMADTADQLRVSVEIFKLVDDQNQ